MIAADAGPAGPVGPAKLAAWRAPACDVPVVVAEQAP
jgi:hypothetical protein